MTFVTALALGFLGGLFGARRGWGWARILTFAAGLVILANVIRAAGAAL